MKRLIIVLCLVFCNAQAQVVVLQDPTKPSVNKLMSNADTGKGALAPSALQLTAIINNNHHKMAIINGKSFVEGQEVQGYSVVLISQNHVILNGLEGKQTLYVNNNNVKKDTNNGY